MKKQFLLFMLFLSFGFGFAQTKDSLSVEEQARREKNIQAGNPFKEFGYTPKIATLSKGKYLEFHDLDSIVQVGSFMYNTRSKSIVSIIENDTLPLSEATLKPEIISRWMSPDPLSDEFPNWSPYNFVMNNPIRYVDPLGLAPFDVILKGKEEAINKVVTNINSGLGGSYASVDKNGQLNINISDEARGNLSKEQSGFLGVLEEAINSDGIVTIGVKEGSDQITFGSFTNQSIDIDDINALGEGEAMNQYSILGHEVKEQFEKQVNKKGRDEAHALGEKAEESITGYVRGADSPMENKKVEKIVSRKSVGTETYYTTSGTQSFNFTKGKTRVTVTTTIVRRNITEVSRDKE